MLQAARVVVGVDPQGVSGAVLDLAVEQATARDLPIDLVHVFQVHPTISLVPVLPDEDWAVDAVRRQADEVLADAERRIAVASSSVPVRRRAVEGATVARLAACAEDAAVLVLGTHAGSRSWLGPVLGGVLTEVERPVVCLPERSSWQPGPVVLATEGTRVTQAATDFAFAQADRWSQPLLAVLAVETGFDPELVGERAREQYLQEGRRRLDDGLVAARDRHPAVEVRETVLLNGLFPTLRRLGRDAGLIVLGSHGRGAVGRVLLGSVSGSMLREAVCPVAVVRTP